MKGNDLEPEELEHLLEVNPYMKWVAISLPFTIGCFVFAYLEQAASNSYFEFSISLGVVSALALIYGSLKAVFAHKKLKAEHLKR